MGEDRLVREQVAETARFLEAARARFTGEEWALDWKEWERVWAQIQGRSAATNARPPRRL